MKIVLAFDSFKGSLSAWQATQAVQQGIQNTIHSAEVRTCPVADGGEGTVKILTETLNGSLMESSVSGPLMEPVFAQWGWINKSKTAIMEVASVAGLTLIPPEKRNPCLTTTRGLGELILQALDKGARKIIIGLGGSATTDGCCGAVQALGVDFAVCDFPMNGGSLINIRSIDISRLDSRIKETEILLAVDVSNPLLGPKGAAQVFAPQKGAIQQQVQLLENGLKHLTTFFPESITDFPGAGAAGGLGWGLKTFLNAQPHVGIDLCLDILGFDKIIRDADLVITGEGTFDVQSLQGKATIGVASRAKALNIPVIILAGDHHIPEKDLKPYGITGCYSICRDFKLPTEKAMIGAMEYLPRLAEKVIKRYI